MPQSGRIDPQSGRHLEPGIRQMAIRRQTRRSTSGQNCTKYRRSTLEFRRGAASVDSKHTGSASKSCRNPSGGNIHDPRSGCRRELSPNRGGCGGHLDVRRPFHNICPLIPLPIDLANFAGSRKHHACHTRKSSAAALLRRSECGMGSSQGYPLDSVFSPLSAFGTPAARPYGDRTQISSRLPRLATPRENSDRLVLPRTNDSEAWHQTMTTLKLI